MAPVPIRFLFRSRWAALIWAAGICISAASFVGDQPKGEATDANAAAADDGNLAQLNALIAQ